ncbi:MAG: xanthine dehydrogenase family protein subunit M, partial [Betaproteobacteria bacterium]|nr:xanthine dehydrogenase family protein subunit M [Betaproteobacteria bacterium]
VCSVAAVITSGIDHVVKDARIVLGAVAGTPYRALRAEDFLRGKVLSAQVAEAAARAAVSEAVPLSKNAYKVDIARALVKRAVVEAGAEPSSIFEGELT